MEPLPSLERTPMTPTAAAAAFKAVALAALTTACERWGCHFNPRTKRCNRCARPDFATMTNDEIDAL